MFSITALRILIINGSEREITFTLYGIQQKHIINFFHVISFKALVTNWQIEYLSENENRKVHII